MDDNCEQQVPSVAVCLQQLTTPVLRWQSCSVYNSCGLLPSQTGGCINICTYFVFETRIYHLGSIWGKSEPGNSISDAIFMV